MALANRSESEFEPTLRRLASFIVVALDVHPAVDVHSDRTLYSFPASVSLSPHGTHDPYTTTP